MEPGARPRVVIAVVLAAVAGVSMVHAADNALNTLPALAQKGEAVGGSDRTDRTAGTAGTQETTSGTVAAPSTGTSYPGFDLSQMDKDGDKKVSKQEYTAHFDDMDKNEDGSLDAEEMREAAITGQAAPVSTSD